MIRIVIADDHALIRDGLQTIIDLQDDMKVVGTAETGQEACHLTEELKPSLVLMDIQMPQMDGIEATKYIKEQLPDTAVLILTTFAEDQYIIDGLVAGADGFLVKNIASAKLIEAIRDAVAGQFMLPTSVAAKLSARLQHLSNSLDSALNTEQFIDHSIQFTEREKQIILLMIQGKNNREISSILFVSEGTVKNYISVIYQKIGTNDRAKAMLILNELIRVERNDV